MKTDSPQIGEISTGIGQKCSQRNMMLTKLVRNDSILPCRVYLVAESVSDGNPVYTCKECGREAVMMESKESLKISFSHRKHSQKFLVRHQKHSRIPHRKHLTSLWRSSPKAFMVMGFTHLATQPHQTRLMLWRKNDVMLIPNIGVKPKCTTNANERGKRRIGSFSSYLCSMLSLHRIDKCTSKCEGVAETLEAM